MLSPCRRSRQRAGLKRELPFWRGPLPFEFTRLDTEAGRLSYRRRVLAERESTEPVKSRLIRSNDGRKRKTRLILHPDDSRASFVAGTASSVIVHCLTPQAAPRRSGPQSAHDPCPPPDPIRSCGNFRRVRQKLPYGIVRVLAALHR